MDSQSAQVVREAEEALVNADKEPDGRKAMELLEKAAAQLVALGNPPSEPLRTIRDRLKTLAAASANAEASGTPDDLPEKIKKQIEKARLPTGGEMPFVPKLDQNQSGEPIIRKETIQHGPMKGKKGYVDSKGKIWIRDRAHGKYPDHWDIQENGGKKGRTRIGDDGNPIP